MRRSLLLTAVAIFGLGALAVFVAPVAAHAKNNNKSKQHSKDKGSKEDDHSDGDECKKHSDAETPKDFVAPSVFQAAGPAASSIQGTVDAFRAALGTPNNANAPGPLASGRREINWDGGGVDTTTTPPVTPFDVFLNLRGGRFTTRGTGLSQGPPTGGPQGGLAGLFGNPSYGTIFTAFSALRLFTPVDSHVTEGVFFVPGTNGGTPATVSGFGAVFTDVDQPDGSGSAGKCGDRPGSTRIEYFGASDDDHEKGKRLFTGFVPASPGDGSLSFLGIIFKDARIARVRITSGNVDPGPDDDRKHDVVVMDDFLYGEPQPVQ